MKGGFGAWGIVLSAGLVGCRLGFGGPALRSQRSQGFEREVEAAERYAQESRTLSHLAVVEKSLSEYIEAEHQIPERLDLLIPKFIAEIPNVELALRGHQDSSEVEYYPQDVIRGGTINGARLRDTGHWGYAFNNHQVIVFVDCTHASSRGKPWYQERGVF